MTPQTKHEHGILDDARAGVVLKTLVEQYVQQGRPVGSRMLARACGLDLSAATVRNIMADLEAGGFVASPHTSAGRVPTVRGYRVFVDSLLTPEPLAGEQALDLRRQLRRQVDDDSGLLASASLLLSSLSDMAGVVTVPRRDQATLRQIEFLPLSGNRVLAILVVNHSEVQNRVLHTGKRYSAAQLQTAANVLNRQLAGRRLPSIRASLAHELDAAQRELDRGIRDAMQLARAVFAEGEQAVAGDYVLAGQANLIGVPELAGSERLQALFEALQHKRDLLALFDECLSASGIRIFIGEESGYRVLDECSVVTAPYTVDGEVVGTLGVIGPTRMAYNRIIPLVATTAELLGSVLKTAN